MKIHANEKKRYRNARYEDEYYYKQRRGCLGGFFRIIWKLIKAFVFFVGAFVILAIVLALNSNDAEKAPAPSKVPTAISTIQKSTPAPTKAQTQKPTATPTIAPTPTPTVKPTEKPIVIQLAHPALGKYGKYYTFNENVAKAEDSDKETIIQCFVPAGRYTVTNEGKYPTYVLVYSEKTVINEDGWEEPAETWGSSLLKVGASCEITVKEGHYINLQENDVFQLIQK